MAQDHCRIDIRLRRASKPEDQNGALAWMSGFELLAMLAAKLDFAHAQRVEGRDLAFDEEQICGDVPCLLESALLEPRLSGLTRPARQRTKLVDRSGQGRIGTELLRREMNPFVRCHGRARVAPKTDTHHRLADVGE